MIPVATAFLIIKAPTKGVGALVLEVSACSLTSPVAHRQQAHGIM